MVLLPPAVNRSKKQAAQDKRSPVISRVTHTHASRREAFFFLSSGRKWMGEKNATKTGESHGRSGRP